MSRKKCPNAPQCGVHVDNTWGSLGHKCEILFNIKWSHIQQNKCQHVKIYSLNDFTFQSKQNILEQAVSKESFLARKQALSRDNNDLSISLLT